VACLGGSTTFCTAVKGEARPWPAVAEAYLNGLLDPNGPYDRCEFINAGVSGYTLLESFVNLKTRVLPLKPDLVIIYHAVNDARAIRLGQFRHDYSHVRKSWVEPPPVPLLDPWLRWSHLYGAIRGGPAANTATALRDLLNVPGYIDLSVRSGPELDVGIKNFAMTLRESVAISRLHGSEVVLATFTWARENEDGSPYKYPDKKLILLMKRLNHVIREVAQQDKTLLIDLYEKGPHSAQYFDDIVHRNNLGNYESGKLVARTLAQSRFLKRAASSRRRAQPGQDADR
jgi:hypothetical protein